MMQNLQEPKHAKLLQSSLIVSPIPKKILSFSNNDNLQSKTAGPLKLENFPSNNSEDLSNMHKFTLHKNSAFRYLNNAKESSILLRNSFCLH